jgi:hypothetical protein
MGKRNLAIVGTHQDYFADMYKEKMGTDPSIVSGCASPEDAATSYFGNVFENSNALIREAVVGVWLTSEGPEEARIFDAYATMTPCSAADAEPGEFDITLDVRERL